MKLSSKVLTNDGSININNLVNEKLIFFGERHLSKSDIEFVRKMISVLQPSFVLVEGLGDLSLKTNIDKAIAAKLDYEELFHGDLTECWINIAHEFDIPFIGIELTDQSSIKDKTNLVDAFKQREEHWTKIIKRYVSSGKSIIVICGDTHLRTISCKELGAESPFYRTFPQATFIRLADPEIK